MDSVVNQTFTEIEMISVDAGSTDGTWEILQEYAKRDPRIRLIKSNRKSYGYQVNLGISESTGDYIGIVETDDFIEPGMYEKLYQCAVQTDADYVKGQGYFTQEILPGEFINYQILDFTHIPENEMIIPSARPELEYWDRFLWLGLYKREFIQKIKLNETPGAAYQDISFALNVHRRAKKAVYLAQGMYHYRIDNSSASSGSRKSFQYLVQERNFMEPVLQTLPMFWRRESLRTTFDQILTRFRTMAYSREFWISELSYIKELQKTLKDAVSQGILSEDVMSEEYWAMLCVFMESEYALYGTFAGNIRTVQEKLRRLQKEIGTRQMVLFGTGARSRFPYALFHRNKIGCLAAACDNALDKVGKKFYDLQTLTPRQAVEAYPDACFLITSRKYETQMRKDLAGLGVSERNIRIYDLPEDFNLLDPLP